jgi:hypothetical protein
MTGPGAVPAPLVLHKYPRTPHLEGSHVQADDLGAVSLAAIAGRHLVVEEKVDGANAALSFDKQGRVWLQSRGHFLGGGPRERHFDLFKRWAYSREKAFWDVLRDRYVVYGEWLYAKHTVFYDCLPHYFVEFDVMDRAQKVFLSTERRRALLTGLPVESVPVVFTGRATTMAELTALIGRSRYKSAAWRVSLRESCLLAGVDAAQVAAETDSTDLMEGLYVKVEEGSRVVARYKFLHPGFASAVATSGSHWLQRPVVPNGLAAGVELFG